MGVNFCYLCSGGTSSSSNFTQFRLSTIELAPGTIAIRDAGTLIGARMPSIYPSRKRQTPIPMHMHTHTQLPPRLPNRPLKPDNAQALAVQSSRHQFRRGNARVAPVAEHGLHIARYTLEHNRRHGHKRPVLLRDGKNAVLLRKQERGAKCRRLAAGQRANDAATVLDKDTKEYKTGQVMTYMYSSKKASRT
jgi:hypothetical protein